MPEHKQSNEPTLSVCICTRDRPMELERILRSIERGPAAPDAVLVSDDSVHPEIARTICDRFPFVTYLAGPRRGLCANRNAAIAKATTQYISLCDDDCIFTDTFFPRLREILPTLQPMEIVCGGVLEYGRIYFPNNPSFLGHFGEVPNGVYRNVNLNSNCFPRAALVAERFDETLKYGYEDMDLCARLLRDGYRIRQVPDLLNGHAPPTRSQQQDEERFAHSEQARFKTSLKRYLRYERKPHLAVLYAVVAPLHRAAHAVLRRRFRDLWRIPGDIIMAVRDALRG